MIIAEDLTKNYDRIKRYSLFKKTKESIEAIKGLNLNIKKGSIHGLLGINGAGKTTAIKILTTLLEPTSGQAYVCGYNILKEKKAIRKQVGLVLGGQNMVYLRLTAIENLKYFGSLYGIPNKELDIKTNELLSIVGLNDVKNIRVEQFSQGMKQRLQIARALINDPAVLFLDEPTVGLDVIISKEIRKTIKNIVLEKNITVLLTTHYMQEAEELTSEITILHHGKNIFTGTPHMIKDREDKIITINLKEKNELLIERLKNIQQINKIELIEGKYNVFYKVDIVPGLIMKIAIENEFNIDEFKIITPSLENAIISITNNAGVS